MTWSVAEKYRYLPSFDYAGEHVHRVRRLLGFRVKVFSMVLPGNKWFGKNAGSLVRDGN